MKKLCIVFFTIMLALSVLPVFATGMPVIDISSITESIAQFVQTVQQYNRQIQQWKSEYERLEKAAKQIAQGDYQNVVNGLASITGQLSKWNIGSTAQDVFANFSEGVMNFDSFYQKASSYYDDMSSILKATENIIRNREQHGEGYSKLGTAVAIFGDLSNGMTAAVTTTAAIPTKALETYENLQNISATLELMQKGDPLGKMDSQLAELKEEKTSLEEQQKQALDLGNSTQAEQYALLAKRVGEQITELAASRQAYKENIDSLKAQEKELQTRYREESSEQNNEILKYSNTWDTLSTFGDRIFSDVQPTFSVSDPTRNSGRKNVL